MYLYCVFFITPQKQGKDRDDLEKTSPPMSPPKNTTKNNLASFTDRGVEDWISGTCDMEAHDFPLSCNNFSSGH